MDPADTTHIVHDRDARKFNLYVDGVLTSSVTYELDGGVITFTHTVTDPSMRARGLAGRVVEHALSDARAAGLKVIARCWYVAEYIAVRPEHRDLLASST